MVGRNAKVAILITITGFLVFAVGFAFSVKDLNSIISEDTTWKANSLNPFYTYKINSNCELFYFLTNGPNMDMVQFHQQNFTKKYPAEMEKIEKAIGTRQFMDYISTYPHDGTKMPLDIKEAMASIIMKEYSINPKLQPSVMDALSYGPQTLMYKIAQDEPGCMQKMQKKQEQLKQEQLQASFVFKIASVLQGSSAEKAGLQPDNIITAINDTQISHLSDLSNIKLQAGKVVIVSVSRNNQTLKIPVTLTPSKDDPEKGILGILRVP